MARRVLITAGGTRESVDDVRLLSHSRVVGGSPDGLSTVDVVTLDNFARGLFGWEFAKAFLARGAAVSLVGSHELVRALGSRPSGLSVHPFRAFCDLENCLRQLLPEFQPDIVLMTAAVSDYSPIRIEGKLDSGVEEIVIRCSRNPKLLDLLRPLTGPETVLVGFKLVSGLPANRLEELARAQLDRADLNYCVGNDLRRIDHDAARHPILLVPRRGEAEEIDGSEPVVAEAVVERIFSGSQLLER